MADSLVLKGVKDVRKHTGSEMVLMRPKRGGDTHQLKKWWLINANSTVYVSCSLFKVAAGAGSVYLAIDSQEMSTIRIDHDGFANFTFYAINGISRAALYDENMALIEHYVFPKISGGKVMTVTPPAGGSRPGAGATTIGTVTLTGATAVTDGATESYTVTKTGDASPAYVLTSSDAADVVSGLDVTFTGAGARTLTVTATDATASDSPATGTLAVNAVVLFSTRVANADSSYAVTVDSGNYLIDGVANAEITASAGDSIHFDMSDASTSGHPIAIYTDASKTTLVTVGIETDENSKDLIFTPPIAGTFSYQCTQHEAMGGTITVS